MLLTASTVGVEAPKTRNPKPSLERQTVIVRKPGTVLYPAVLPNLTENMQKAFEKGIIDNDRALQLALIRHMGTHLRDTVGNRPSTKDFQNFSLTVVEKYSCLADDTQARNVSLHRLR